MYLSPGWMQLHQRYLKVNTKSYNSMISKSAPAPSNYRAVTAMLVTQDNFAPVMELLDNQKRLIHDTEGTGLDRWHDDYIVGHAFTTPRLDGPFYFPVAHR